MAYKMKGHTLPGINQRSDEKMDLTKKTGLGPRAEVKELKEDKGPTEIEMQNTGDFNISNLHKDTNAKLAKDHDVSANITEGSIESQDLRRKENEKKKKK